MSALSTYSATNRVIDSGKAVTYSKTRVPGVWTYKIGAAVTETIYHAWEYVRHCTKTYRYVGLSESAAATCAAAMISKYTRSVDISTVKTTTITSGGEAFEDISGGKAVMARVDARYNGAGQLWTVCIAVDEIDTKMRSSGLYTFATLFSSENGRDYDEGNT